MIKINAHHNCSYDYTTKQHTLFPEQPTGIQVRAEFTTEEDAQAFLKLFPKYVGLKLSKPYGKVVWMNVQFSSNGVTGEANEAGLKRYRKLMAVIDQHAVPYTFAADKAVNAYTDRAAFEAAI